jgi:hypothetical protein
MHVNIIIVGESQIGKSFLIDNQIAVMIPGTYAKLLGSSSMADLTDEVKDLDMKCDFSHELPPSVMGIENSNANVNGKNNQAMTDKASRQRASMTDAGNGWRRLGKNSEGKFERSTAAKEINRALVGCMNLCKHQLPDNFQTRVLVIEAVQKVTILSFSLFLTRFGCSFERI